MFLNSQLQFDPCFGKAGVTSTIVFGWPALPFPPDKTCDFFRFDASNWVYGNHTFQHTLSSTTVDTIISQGHGLGLELDLTAGEFIQFLGAEVQLNTT